MVLITAKTENVKENQQEVITCYFQPCLSVRTKAGERRKAFPSESGHNVCNGLMTKAVKPSRALRPQDSQSQQHAKNKEATTEDQEPPRLCKVTGQWRGGCGEETTLTDVK